MNLINDLGLVKLGANPSCELAELIVEVIKEFNILPSVITSSFASSSTSLSGVRSGVSISVEWNFPDIKNEFFVNKN